jgi:4-hydroxybenzoate polyprenyltransferase
MNDIRDAESDRCIASKQRRPIASGAIGVQAAWVFAGVVLVLFLGMTVFWLGFRNNGMPVSSKVKAVLVLGCYAVMNIGYSFGLKKIPIVDVSIIATGFILRFLLGVIIIGETSTVWFYLIILAASYYMSFGKRRNEISVGGDASRTVLKQYSRDFLDKNMYVCQTLCIVFYTFWTIDPVTVERMKTTAMSWTVPVVLLILFKYSLDIETCADGDPTAVLLKDKALLLLCAVYVAGVIAIVSGVIN